MAVDFKQVLGIAKKNAVSISAGVVALACVAVPFVVVDGMVSDTEAAMGARKSVAESVSSIANKQRSLPNLNPDASNAATLEVFPSPPVIAEGNKAVEEFKKQTAALLEAAVKLNQRKPLVPELFTAPPQRFNQYAYDFRDQYYRVMPESLTKRVNGGMPFTQEQVTQAVQNEKERINSSMSLRVGGNVTNQAEITAAIAKAEVEVPLALRAKVANDHAVYVNPDTWAMVSPQTMPPSGPPPSPLSIWMAQMGMWLQQDICDYVNAMNDGSKSILTSPVKHVVKVGFGGSTSTGPYVLPKGGGEGGGLVTVTRVSASAAITPNHAYTITGRVGNGLYDVVTYNLVVRVAESKVAQFLAEIPKNRLHYVLNVNLRSVDSTTEATTYGFLYGTEPVVELSVDCEALFLRQWTDPLMPKAVKQLVGIEEAPAGAAGSGGGGFGGPPPGYPGGGF